MLVNAEKFPGPALWQGLMLIALTIWFVLDMYSMRRIDKEKGYEKRVIARKKHESFRETCLIVLIVYGMGSAGLIMYYL
jgi:hypothetical protein